ncbi:MAG TPA: ABC transporter ATP-binding protein [Planctomycetes bacterium]|nr:ABC transporter ATP-binding protein [Planctomycetota bacterium]HIK62098.1 ABC transporter ATP-binding protein [Planctomycetota bacterium]
MPLLELQGVTRSFGGSGDSATTEVLRGISLVLDEGEALAIVGPSGCGKTSLLNLIGGLDQPDEGSIRLGGRDLAQMNAEELASMRAEELGFVFQAHHLLPQCTALENVLVPSLVCTDANLRGSAPERARALLDRVGLGERHDHFPAQLSGGEAQRVAVVRALINEPRLILADEPTGSLDGESAQQLGDLLLEVHAEQGTALIVVTHSNQLAERLGKQLSLRGGRVESGVDAR